MPRPTSIAIVQATQLRNRLFLASFWSFSFPDHRAEVQENRSAFANESAVQSVIQIGAMPHLCALECGNSAIGMPTCLVQAPARLETIATTPKPKILGQGISCHQPIP